VGGGWLDQLKLRITQPQVELEAWPELGNKHVIICFCIFDTFKTCLSICFISDDLYAIDFVQSYKIHEAV
jgi:hypothetical protein